MACLQEKVKKTHGHFIIFEIEFLKSNNFSASNNVEVSAPKVACRDQWLAGDIHRI